MIRFVDSAVYLWIDYVRDEALAAARYARPDDPEGWAQETCAAVPTEYRGAVLAWLAVEREDPPSPYPYEYEYFIDKLYFAMHAEVKNE